MKHLLTLAALLAVSPPVQLPAFGADHPGLPRMDGLASAEKAPTVSKDWVPKLIPHPSTTETYRRAKRTCTGVASMALGAAEGM